MPDRPGRPKKAYVDPAKVARKIPAARKLYATLNRAMMPDIGPDLPRIFKGLGDDLDRVTAKIERLEALDEKEGLAQDDELSLRTHRIARLALYEAAALAAAIESNERGLDVRVLRELTKALSSAQTGSGEDYKKLQPDNPKSRSRPPLENDLRARLVALAELMKERGVDRLPALYDAAARQGLDRKVARKVVSNAMQGQLSDHTLTRLVEMWKLHWTDRDLSGDLAPLFDEAALGGS